ncbi:MAG: hypothetical protein JRG97_08395 [Deltaproteobacteria bacterium]|nr:hypothetical protein [Deltaproteobacteria bacterium]MBW2052578.1 hypothetical protein [Deltaproteobacteria bacterium]MBW2141078.1 hypothetical protein [Deltaproteobacteria bacterium]MBW2322621.1 hypothetical protein [Deltaproteobacteria bacterium]
MPDWNELFKEEKNRARFPETEVYKFVRLLEEMFQKRSLRLWDVCCGGLDLDILAIILL